MARVGYSFAYFKAPTARVKFVPFIMLPQLGLPFLAIVSCIMLATNTEDATPTIHKGGNV